MRRLPQARNRPSATPSERNPTSTRLGGARQPADPPRPSLRPFNQARSGPLGIQSAKRSANKAQRRDLKVAERRWSATSEQALVRYGVLNAEATRSSREGLEAEPEQPAQLADGRGERLKRLDGGGHRRRAFAGCRGCGLAATENGSCAPRLHRCLHRDPDRPGTRRFPTHLGASALRPVLGSTDPARSRSKWHRRAGRSCPPKRAGASAHGG
jgi:hypothetical protein